jgi:hypothetical protein
MYSITWYDFQLIKFLLPPRCVLLTLLLAVRRERMLCVLRLVVLQLEVLKIAPSV